MNKINKIWIFFSAPGYSRNVADRDKCKVQFVSAWKSPSKCPDLLPVMFIFIKDFVIEEIDDFSNILITNIDPMGKLEQPKRFDRKTIYDNRGWIQDGYFNIKKNSMIIREGWGFEWGLMW